MAFTLAAEMAYYRAHPDLRARYQRTWNRNHPGVTARYMRERRMKQRRKAEIAAAKAVLMSAHRLRAIGVRPK